MKILGIDPGLRRTGYGLIEANGQAIKLLEAGTVEPKEKDLLENRLYTIYKNLDDLIAEYKPDIMVLEKIYTHYRHPTTASLLGHVRGVICLAGVNRKLKMVEQSVKRMRKGILGTGAASKIQTRGMVAHLLRVDEAQLTQDASDALALALGYAQSLGGRA